MCEFDIEKIVDKCFFLLKIVHSEPLGSVVSAYVCSLMWLQNILLFKNPLMKMLNNIEDFPWLLKLHF